MLKGQTEKRRWFSYKPEADTWIALASIPAMTLIYYLNTQYGFETPAIFFIGFVCIGHLLLNTVLPAYVVLIKRGEGLAGLGITSNRLAASLIISSLLAASMYPSLQAALKGFEGRAAPNIVYNSIALWEPLFVFGWLQLRFERAFGIVSGIFMASLGFMTYHIGSFPIEGLIGLFASGLIYAAIFACVRNLFVLLPMTWATGSTIGTIQGGYIFDWMTVGIYFAVLAMQIFILWYLSRPKKAAVT